MLSRDMIATIRWATCGSRVKPAPAVIAEEPDQARVPAPQETNAAVANGDVAESDGDDDADEGHVANGHDNRTTTARHAVLVAIVNIPHIW